MLGRRGIAADHGVTLRTVEDHVLRRQGGIDGEGIVASAAGDRAARPGQDQPVVAVAAVEAVIAACAPDDVVSRTGIDKVISATAIDVVIAGKAPDAIRLVRPAQRIAPARPHDLRHETAPPS